MNKRDLPITLQTIGGKRQYAVSGRRLQKALLSKEGLETFFRRKFENGALTRGEDFEFIPAKTASECNDYLLTLRAAKVVAKMSPKNGREALAYLEAFERLHKAQDAERPAGYESDGARAWEAQCEKIRALEAKVSALQAQVAALMTRQDGTLWGAPIRVS